MRQPGWAHVERVVEQHEKTKREHKTGLSLLNKLVGLRSDSIQYNFAWEVLLWEGPRQRRAQVARYYPPKTG